MNDRELLEKAAKAAGEITPSWYGNQNYLDGVLGRWNPLTDDGDALRLMVDLRILLRQRSDMVDAKASPFVAMRELYGTDPYAATRRAIVRAAAEIGKEMP